MKNKLLILCPGRQTYLVSLFEKYFDVYIGDNAQTTLDTYYNLPSVKMPRYDSESYLSILTDYIQKNSIEFLVTLSDVEVVLLTKNESVFKQYNKHVGNGQSHLLQDLKDDISGTYPKTYKKNGNIEEEVKSIKWTDTPQPDVTNHKTDIWMTSAQIVEGSSSTPSWAPVTRMKDTYDVQIEWSSDNLTPSEIS